MLTNYWAKKVIFEIFCLWGKVIVILRCIQGLDTSRYSLKPKNEWESWGFEPAITKRPEFTIENSIFQIEF